MAETDPSPLSLWRTASRCLRHFGQKQSIPLCVVSSEASRCARRCGPRNLLNWTRCRRWRHEKGRRINSGAGSRDEPPCTYNAHSAIDLHPDCADPVLSRRSDVSRQQRTRTEAPSAAAIVEGGHGRLERRKLREIGPRPEELHVWHQPSDRVSVVHTGHSHACLLPEQGWHAVGQKADRTVRYNRR